MDFTDITHYDLMLMPALGGRHCEFADALALTLTSALTWVPMYLALLYVVAKKHKAAMPVLHIILCAGLCILLADGMADGIAKPLTGRLRPLNDPEVSLMITLVAGAEDSNYSFFSAHAANTFSLCVFFSLMMRNMWLTLSMTLWSITNCWTRIYLGMHYPSDIFVGLIWGGISGCMAYYVFRKIWHKIAVRYPKLNSEYTHKDVIPVIAIIIITFISASIHAAI